MFDCRVIGESDKSSNVQLETRILNDGKKVFWQFRIAGAPAWTPWTTAACLNLESGTLARHFNSSNYLHSILGLQWVQM